MSYNPNQKRQAKGAPMAGAWAPDNTRNGAAPASTTAQRTVQDVLDDEGYITVPNYNDGSEFDAAYQDTALADRDFQLSLDRETTSIAVPTHGLPPEQLAQVGLETWGEDDPEYASLTIPKASNSIAEAEALITSDPRYAIATQLQDPESRAKLADRVSKAPPYDPDAASAHSEEHAMDGYVPEQVEDFLEAVTEHYPNVLTMGHLQNSYPEELDWWQSLGHDRQEQILADVAAVPEPEGDDRFLQYPEYREKIRQIAGAKEEGYDGATVYDDPDNSYMGGNASIGSNYERSKSMTNAEISRAIRKDIKDAQQSGYLPKAAKISVRSYAGNYSVGVSGLPKELLTERRYRHDSDFEHYRGRRSGYGSELSGRVEMIAGSYGRSSTNSQVDYFNSYRTANVRFEE